MKLITHLHLVLTIVQLDGATELLKSKNDKVLELESQIGKLEVSLATALAEVEVKTTSKEEAENSKAVVEAQLQETQASLSKLETDVLNVNVALSSIQEEV